MMAARVAAVWLVLGVAPAQQVVPSIMAGQEGGSSSLLPFGLNTPMRYQAIYDASELPFLGPTPINGIRIRADWAGDTHTIPEKRFIAIQGSISTSETTSESVSDEFARNHGSDKSEVVFPRRIALPQQLQLPRGPRPFNIDLSFDQPFIYGLSPFRGGRRIATSLVLDLRIGLQPGGSYPVDNPANCVSQTGSFGQIGPGCLTSTGQPLTIASSSSINAGGTAQYVVDNMPPDAPFAVVLGVSERGFFYLGGQAHALPFELTDVLAPGVGAPGCYINVEWLLSSIGQADALGTGRLSIPIPFNRLLVGKPLYAQAICRDIQANPLLHVTSGGVWADICGPLGIARVHSIGDDQAQTGQINQGSALIFDVR